MMIRRRGCLYVRSRKCKWPLGIGQHHQRHKKRLHHRPILLPKQRFRLVRSDRLGRLGRLIPVGHSDRLGHLVRLGLLGRSFPMAPLVRLHLLDLLHRLGRSILVGHLVRLAPCRPSHPSGHLLRPHLRFGECKGRNPMLECCKPMYHQRHPFQQRSRCNRHLPKTTRH